MKTVKNNIFDDDNYSIFYLLEIIIARWKHIMLLMLLSLPLSGVYYFYADESYKSNSIILIGKKHAQDHDFLEPPTILAKKIKHKYSSHKDIDKITVKTNTISFYETVQRTMEISLESNSPDKSQKLLSMIVDAIIKKHYSLYLYNKKINEIDGENKTLIILKPTYAVRSVNPINITVFIKGLLFSLLIGCFSVLFLHHLSYLRKNH